MNRDRSEDKTKDFERFLRRPTRRGLERLVRDFYAHVHAVSLRVTGNEADASEVSQDLFLSLILLGPLYVGTWWESLRRLQNLGRHR